MIIPPKPRISSRLKASIAAIAALGALAAGAGVYYQWFRTEKAQMQPAPVPVTRPSTTAPLVSRPIETAPAPVSAPLVQPTVTTGLVSRPAATTPPAVTKKTDRTGKKPGTPKKKKKRTSPQQ
jgi:hypothetical protein